MPGTYRLAERPVTPQAVHKILRNRYYLGIVRYAGTEYPGRHEPLVDHQTFEAVQHILTSRNLAGDKPQRRPHPLKGTLYCGRCGRRFGIVFANGRGGQYPYFYCLGRQKDASGCPQSYVAIERVEAAVLKHWDTYQLTDERRQQVRAKVLDLFRSQTAGAEREIGRQQARVSTIKHQQQKARDAYYNDALTIEEFKAEQQRLGRELTAAEAVLQRYLLSVSSIERGVDDLLKLTTSPAAFYDAAPDAIKRMLLQQVFERIWLVDDEIVGVDLTRPFAEMLTVEAQLDARRALTGTDEASITYERRNPAILQSIDVRRFYARAERPFGWLAFDRKNPRLVEQDEGSNLLTLVGVAGFEPTTSSSRTKRATKLRHTPSRPSCATGPA